MGTEPDSQKPRYDAEGMTNATAIALGAAIIGATGSLTGALVGSWTQHRLLMKQFKLSREEDERKRQLAEQERQKAERRADEEERDKLIRRLSDLRFPRSNPIRQMLPRSAQSYGETGLDERDLQNFPTSTLRQIEWLALADANAEGERAEFRQAVDNLKHVVREVTTRIHRARVGPHDDEPSSERDVDTHDE